MGRRESRRWLWAILGVAVLLRVASAAAMGDRIEVLPGISDQVSYHMLAQRVLDGHGFTVPTEWWPATHAGEPTAHWSYLYTLYLAGVYALVGVHPLAARLIQAIIGGVLGPWLAYRIGSRISGPAVGLISAAVTAVYIYLVYYGAALVTETFFILAVLGVIDLSLRMAERPSRRGWVFLGVALGVAALLRQTILLFIPFLLLWLLWAGRGRVRLGGLVVSMSIVVLFILPCTVHNYLAFGRLVPLNTNAGFAFFWANHPAQGSNFVSVLGEGQPSYRSLIPPELRDLDEATLSQVLMRRGIGFVLEDPARYVLLSLSRVKDYFKFWPSADSGMLSNISRTLSFGLFLPFMIYGLLRSARDWRRWSLLYLFVAVYTLVHLASWALIRYRLPVDAVLIVFAGLALVDLYHRLADRALFREPSLPTSHPDPA